MAGHKAPNFRLTYIYLNQNNCINTNYTRRIAYRFPPLQSREAAVPKVLKLVSYAVLVLMASAILYAGVIGMTYWTGIGV